MADEGEFPGVEFLGTAHKLEIRKKISSSKQISRSGREGQLNHGKK